jgi:hypothetical protein
MGKKVSDEWVVPLCVIHHRALHDVGSEEMWWQEHHIDALAEAEKLWRVTHPTGDPIASEPVSIEVLPVAPGNSVADVPPAPAPLVSSNGRGNS